MTEMGLCREFRTDRRGPLHERRRTVHGPFTRPLAPPDRQGIDAGVPGERIRTLARACAHGTGGDR